MSVRWVTAFVDLPVPAVASGVAFWQQVTGSALSPWRGKQDEFATLLPPDGTPYLRVQKMYDGPGGVHLDLHVDDVRAAADGAVARGASLVHAEEGWVVLTSPGGLGLCLVGLHGHPTPPAPVAWPQGHRSLVDQVCLDIPAGRFEAERDFWAGLTGWQWRDEDSPEFERLLRPDGQALHLLLQRLDDEAGRVRAHLDLAGDDRQAEVERHLALGAAEVRRTPGWVTLRGPAGDEYCVTSRHPDTSLHD